MEYFGINGLDIIGTPIDSDGDGVYDYNDFAPSDSNVQVPQLNISRDGQSVIISWIAHPGLSVKYSSDLTSFTPVTGNIESSGNQSIYTELIGNDQKFFKLSIE